MPDTCLARTCHVNDHDCVFQVLKLPVAEEHTDFHMGNRVDAIRATDSYNGTAWHSDVSLFGQTGGRLLFGRVLLLFYPDTCLGRAGLVSVTFMYAQVLLLFSLNFAVWGSGRTTKMVAAIRWYQEQRPVCPNTRYIRLQWAPSGNPRNPQVCNYTFNA